MARITNEYLQELATGLGQVTGRNVQLRGTGSGGGKIVAVVTDEQSFDPLEVIERRISTELSRAEMVVFLSAYTRGYQRSVKDVGEASRASVVPE